jgi:phage gp36-like protein
MPYCAEQDLIDRYGEQELLQLSDRDSDGTADPEVIAQALADADAEIDGYLRDRYALPLSPVPPSLTLAACRIARYQLYSVEATDKVQGDYDRAISWLRDVSRGLIRLVESTGESAAETAGMPEFEGGRSEFSGGGF